MRLRFFNKKEKDKPDLSKIRGIAVYQKAKRFWDRQKNRDKS